MLRGWRILILEDEPLIAMELAETIAANRGIVAALARTEKDALEAAEALEIDAAILDVRLRETDSFGVAKKLTAMGIPFLFCTGDLGNRGQFDAWPDAPVIAKPYKTANLLAALLRLARKQI